MIMKELAEKIVSEVRKLLTEGIIVVDTNGIIMASTDPERVNTFHEGALIACTMKDKLIITEQDQAVLKGVKAGINLPVFFQRNVVGVIGITGEPDTVSPFGEIIRKMTELLISENYYTEQFDFQSRSIEAFLLDWLQLKEWNDAFINRAKLLDIDLTSKRRVMLAEFKQDSSAFHRDVWLSIISWFERGKDDIIARWGNDQIIYVLSPNGQEQIDIQDKASRFHQFLSKRLKVAVSLGIGSVVAPAEFARSYHQAERALNARKSATDLIFDQDLTLEMILDEINKETKDEFLKRTIQPIIGDLELLTTLRTLFENHFSLKKTAEALHIHINTLHYRLKKITEMTSLNPRNIDELFIIYLSLQFLDKYTKN